FTNYEILDQSEELDDLKQVIETAHAVVLLQGKADPFFIKNWLKLPAAKVQLQKAPACRSAYVCATANRGQKVSTRCEVRGGGALASSGSLSSESSRGTAKAADMTPQATDPYPGLRSFEGDEADIFFGRDDCIDGMLDRLRETRFLAVLGSSGTGKSSLVKT